MLSQLFTVNGKQKKKYIGQKQRTKNSKTQKKKKMN